MLAIAAQAQPLRILDWNINKGKRIEEIAAMSAATTNKTKTTRMAKATSMSRSYLVEIEAVLLLWWVWL